MQGTLGHPLCKFATGSEVHKTHTILLSSFQPCGVKICHKYVPYVSILKQPIIIDPV